MAYIISPIRYISISSSISSSPVTAIVIVMSIFIFLFSRSNAPPLLSTMVTSNASPSASTSMPRVISISNWYVLISSSASITPSTISCDEGPAAQAVKERTTTSTRAIAKILCHILSSLCHLFLFIGFYASAASIPYCQPAPAS